MKSLAIKIAFLCLTVCIGIAIFSVQVNIKKLNTQYNELSDKATYLEDKNEYAAEKLEKIKSGDKEVLGEVARDNFGLYAPNEEIMINDAN